MSSKKTGSVEGIVMILLVTGATIMTFIANPALLLIVLFFVIVGLIMFFEK